MWLRKLIHAWRGPSRYHQPQSFSAEYRVSLTNQGSNDQRFWLIIPRVLETPFQKPTAPAVFSPSDASLITEPVFKNTAVVWPVSLLPRQTKDYTQVFSIAVAPLAAGIPEGLKISDYARAEQKYLAPNRFFLPRHPEIQAVARDLMGNGGGVKEFIVAANLWVMHTLTYGDPIEGLYNAAEALARERVDCGGFDTLLGSVLQAGGIPVRLACGFLAGYPINPMHAWLEILLPDGQWIGADPSMEQLRQLGKTHKSGALGRIGSDRIVFSYGCDLTFNLEGQTIPADILQNPIIHPASALNDIGLKTQFITRTL